MDKRKQSDRADRIDHHERKEQPQVGGAGDVGGDLEHPDRRYDSHTGRQGSLGQRDLPEQSPEEGTP